MCIKYRSTINTATNNERRGLGWSLHFPIFDISIRCQDIRDQSLKLSEIAPNLGRFFALPNFRGGGTAAPPPKSCTQVIMPVSRHVTWKMFLGYSPKTQCYRRAYAVLYVNFWMFIVKNSWGIHITGGVCASKPWSFSSACKNLRGQHPLA